MRIVKVKHGPYTFKTAMFYTDDRPEIGETVLVHGPKRWRVEAVIEKTVPTPEGQWCSWATHA